MSTCNRPRTGLAFCSVACWDAHVPVLNHRDAWCTEERAPREDAADPAVTEPRRRIAASPAPEREPAEVLIIASRLKDYITARADMNTSADVMDALSDLVRAHTDAAIRRARAEGRKTVKARDFAP